MSTVFALTFISRGIRIEFLLFRTMLAGSLRFTLSTSRNRTKYTFILILIISLLAYTNPMIGIFVPTIWWIAFNTRMLYGSLITMNTCVFSITRLANVVLILIFERFANAFFAVIAAFSVWIWTSQTLLTIFLTCFTSGNFFETFFANVYFEPIFRLTVAFSWHFHRIKI